MNKCCLLASGQNDDCLAFAGFSTALNLDVKSIMHTNMHNAHKYVKSIVPFVAYPGIEERTYNPYNNKSNSQFCPNSL